MRRDEKRREEKRREERRRDEKRREEKSRDERRDEMYMHHQTFAVFLNQWSFAGT